MGTFQSVTDKTDWTVWLKETWAPEYFVVCFPVWFLVSLYTTMGLVYILVYILLYTFLCRAYGKEEATILRHQELWTEEICCLSPASDTFLCDAHCVCPTLSIHCCSCKQCIAQLQARVTAANCHPQNWVNMSTLALQTPVPSLLFCHLHVQCQLPLFTGSLQHSDWPAFELDTNHLVENGQCSLLATFPSKLTDVVALLQKNEGGSSALATLISSLSAWQSSRVEFSGTNQVKMIVCHALCSKPHS